MAYTAEESGRTHWYSSFWTDTDSGLGRIPVWATSNCCAQLVAKKPSNESSTRVESGGYLRHIETSLPGKRLGASQVFVLAYPNPDAHHHVIETTLEPERITFEIGPLPAGRYCSRCVRGRNNRHAYRYTFADWGWTYFPAYMTRSWRYQSKVVEGNQSRT